MDWNLLGLVINALFIVLSVSLNALAWSGHSHLKKTAKSTPPLVSTPAGLCVGVVSTSVLDGNNYVSYRSIPYAKPPIGALRFQRPQPLDNTSPGRMLNSENYQLSCLNNIERSIDPGYGEDCLYLNVYVPGSGGQIRYGKDPLPVMVWIHGGGYVALSAFPEPGRMVTRGQVIVVTINYRLGVLGFLTTEDNTLPPNNGLWDQFMALKWVKDNIQFFNGDDTSITVFGESAGGYSTLIHTLSPVSANLFHKAIVQSGFASLSQDAKQRAMEFAGVVGCPTTSRTQMVRCLKTTSVDDILKNQDPSSFNITLARRQLDFIWTPVVDGVFIPDEPLTLLRNQTYLENIGAFNKDYLIGFLNNEGALAATNLLNPISLSQVSNPRFFSDMVDYLLFNRFGSNLNKTPELVDAIYTFYTGDTNRSPSLYPQAVLDMVGDAIFITPTIEMALSLSSCSLDDAIASCLMPPGTVNATAGCQDLNSKVFLYHFDYCPVSDPCSPQCMVHGAEIALEFPSRNFTLPVEQQLSDTFVDLLTTFALSSDPGTSVSSGWPTFDHTSRSYLRIGINPSVRRGYVYDYQVNFWLNTVESLAQFSP